MRYWPAALTYGNWGGPGWSGGKFVSDPKLVDWSVDCIDEMDKLFKQHDWDVQHGMGRAAHKKLTIALEKLDPPAHWGRWPRAYRLDAIGIFTVLGAWA